MEIAGELALIFIALAAGGFLKGAVGAGAPVVAIPVLVLFFGVQFAVAVMVIPNTLSNLWQAWQYREHALPARLTWAFAAAATIGVVSGSAILATAPPDVLLFGVAGAVFAFIVFRLARPDWILSLPAAQRILWPAGLSSGVLQGSTGISAPVILTYFNSMRLSRVQFIATISVAFAAMSLVQIPVLFGFGIMDGTRFLYGLLANLPLMGAMPLGALAAKRVPAKVFDRLILGLLALIAIRMIWKAVTG